MGRSVRLVALLMVVMAWWALPVWAQGADLSRAVTWVKAQQQPDGGFSDGFSEGSNVGATVDAVFAAVAVGEDVSQWGSPSPLDFLASQAGRLERTGEIAKTILVAVATGQDPTTFGDVDLVAALLARYDERTGRFEGLVTDHAFAMLALKNAGQPVPSGAAEALKALQADGGGWAFDGSSQPDTNTTALAIQALVAAGEPASGEAMTRALDFLRAQQNEDGGFPYQKPSDFGTETDANSTAWAIQGLVAAGQSLDDWNAPHQALAALQAESGAFQWKAIVPGDNFLATAQAVPALAGVTFVEVPTVSAATPPQVTPAPQTLPTTGTENTAAWPVAVLVGVGAVLLLVGLAVSRRGLVGR
ncbi:MAG: terpene cyclase/mutase family protein [Ardenticatenia bacterium]|nr:terpene cyclase/mutase family protein [Ardenticatenia bacterium]